MSKIYWIGNYNPDLHHEQLAIVTRPRGNEWLSDELLSLRAQGIDVIISFLESHERYELGLVAENTLAQNVGIEYLNYPIRDRQIPDSLWETQIFIQQVTEFLDQGKAVGVHCRQSVGRAGFMAATILVEKGQTVDDAFINVENARGRSVPDTEEQRGWVRKYAKMKQFFQDDFHSDMKVISTPYPTFSNSLAISSGDGSFPIEFTL